MTQLFRRLQGSDTNGPEIAWLITQLIGAKISALTLRKEVEEHPDYPSLLSISDIFTNHGVENIAFKIDSDRLSEISSPFLIQLKGVRQDEVFFSVVREINKDEVVYFDPIKHIWVNDDINDFTKIATGIVLLFGSGDGVCEEDYLVKIQVEKRKIITRNARIFSIPILAVILGVFYLFQNGVSVLFPFIYMLLAIVGCGIGALLIWYEVDSHNPLLNQICTAGKKINCGAILQSGASKIIGISWSSIGFSYFASLLILLIFGGFDNNDILYMLSWGSMLALPYLLFSIYYQWRIAKQWCILCLSVLLVLILQNIVSGLASWHSLYTTKSISLDWIIQALTAFILPLAVTNGLMSLFQEVKEGGESFLKLQRLKNNFNIFDTLLKNERELSLIPMNLGLTLGNPNGKYKIIKVCNPYCGPCAKAHRPLESLLDSNDDLCIQILFTATNDKNDIRAAPVRHLLAISEKYGEKLLKQALDDWYLDGIQDYKAFAKKYPMSKEINQQGHKIDMMKNWCDKINIDFTPTFFISINEDEKKSLRYFEMPRIYNVKDLKYFFKK